MLNKQVIKSLTKAEVDELEIVRKTKKIAKTQKIAKTKKIAKTPSKNDDTDKAKMDKQHNNMKRPAPPHEVDFVFGFVLFFVFFGVV